MSRPTIKELEERGELDPNCKYCQENFYPQLLDEDSGRDFTSIFAPRHKPNPYCRSGKRPHCTCDTCF